jgi:hypothetical protein
MSRDMIKFPIISGCLSAFYLLFGMVTNRILLPKAAIGSDVPNRTASFINGTMAPGLSAFTYINEFGGPGAAGLGSLMDVRRHTDSRTHPCLSYRERSCGPSPMLPVQISVKFYQLVVMDTLMHFCSPKESNIQMKRSGGNPLMAAVKAIFKDNINIAILAGLIMCVHSAACLCLEDLLPDAPGSACFALTVLVRPPACLRIPGLAGLRQARRLPISASLAPQSTVWPPLRYRTRPAPCSPTQHVAYSPIVCDAATYHRHPSCSP